MPWDHSQGHEAAQAVMQAQDCQQFKGIVMLKVDVEWSLETRLWKTLEPISMLQTQQ